MSWNDKILEAIDKEELRLQCNPLENFKKKQEESYFFILIFD
ncbi:MAG TPA: hypothetical protein VMV49_10230 [Candidatus Deferrimicrobium sp.]|nr:hypothetical protein [Candidatus Deferrimicrobium sp.]